MEHVVTHSVKPHVMSCLTSSMWEYALCFGRWKILSGYSYLCICRMTPCNQYFFRSWGCFAGGIALRCKSFFAQHVLLHYEYHPQFENFTVCHCDDQLWRALCLHFVNTCTLPWIALHSKVLWSGVKLPTTFKETCSCTVMKSMLHFKIQWYTWVTVVLLGRLNG